MTRCTLLDTWFNAKSKELDEAEKELKEDLIAGGNKVLGKKELSLMSEKSPVVFKKPAIVVAVSKW